MQEEKKEGRQEATSTFQRDSNHATHGQMAYLAMPPQEDLSSAVSEEGASRPRTRELSTTEEEIKPDLCPVEIYHLIRDPHEHMWKRLPGEVTHNKALIVRHR